MSSSLSPSSGVPSSAPPSSSSPTSPVRYFDRLPNELVRVIVADVGPVQYESAYADRRRQVNLRALCLVSRRFRSIAQPLLSQVVHLFSKDRGRTTWHKLTTEDKQRMLVLVIHDPFGGETDAISDGSDRVGFFDGTPNLTHLTVQDGSPLLWTNPGSLQFLSYSAVFTLTPPPPPTSFGAEQIFDFCVWRGGTHELDEREWKQLFPSLRLLDFDVIWSHDSPLLQQLDFLQYSFYPFETNAPWRLAELRPNGFKVLPVVTAQRADLEHVPAIAEAIVAWTGLPIAIHDEASDGIDEFVRDLLRALEDLKPLPETFKTLYLPSHARPSITSPSNDIVEASLDRLVRDGVEVVFEDCPVENRGDPFTRTQLLRERVHRRRLKEQERSERSGAESSA
ncbi:hypothetical protein JCM10212_003946 [Sporobolomyces blumeae]